MNGAIVLACGNTLRGDDGIAVHLARELDANLKDTQTEILCSQQWTPELAVRISHAEVAIFVDASTAISPGEIQVQTVVPAAGATGVTTHSMSPAQLLALALHVYGRAPQRAFLMTIGGASFAHVRQFSAPVRDAIPGALEKIKELLAGTSAETSKETTP
jgi:hydrogenase maturation protease